MLDGVYLLIVPLASKSTEMRNVRRKSSYALVLHKYAKHWKCFISRHKVWCRKRGETTSRGSSEEATADRDKTDCRWPRSGFSFDFKGECVCKPSSLLNMCFFNGTKWDHVVQGCFNSLLGQTGSFVFVELWASKFVKQKIFKIWQTGFVVSICYAKDLRHVVMVSWLWLPVMLEKLNVFTLAIFWHLVLLSLNVIVMFYVLSCVLVPCSKDSNRSQKLYFGTRFLYKFT